MKRVIIDKQTKYKYKDQEIQIPMILLSMLGIMFKKHKSKWDDVILITGAVGSAKSTMAQLLAGTWQHMQGKELTLNNFTWSSKGIVDFIDAEGNDNEVIVYDEAIVGGTGRATLTKEGNSLKIGLVVGRRKRHVYIMILDEIQEFSKKIISRSSMLIDMRTMMVKGEPRRGYFKVYNEKELREIYWLLKDQKIKYISQYSATQKPFFKFRDCTNKFIGEEEYEEEKILQTRQLEESKGSSLTPEQMTAFYMWAKGVKQTKIAKDLDMNTSTLGNWVQKFKNNLLPLVK